MTDSVFKKLKEIDISTMVKQKGNFWYMPWSNAVREVLKNFPDAEWEFTSYDGLPYLKTEVGYFVEFSFTIESKTRKQMMPVLDFKNQTNKSPTAADINKAQMRALAKAIALHGLGLELWAGEDLVPTEGDQANQVEMPTEEQIKSLVNLCHEKGRTHEQLLAWATSSFKREFKCLDQLTLVEYEMAVSKVEGAK